MRFILSQLFLFLTTLSLCAKCVNNINIFSENGDQIEFICQENSYLIVNSNNVSFLQLTGTSVCHLVLHTDWIQSRGYTVDAIVDMNLPEQGISGLFRITSIKHILPQKRPESDPGDEYKWKPVTGLFTHVSDDVWKITFDNGEVLGVTNNHPVYSVSKGDWQLAGHLEIGEEVLAKDGNTKVVSKERDYDIRPVYNLEVKDLHNFLVGERGVVVHNSYWGGTFRYEGRGIQKAIDHIWLLHSFSNKRPGIKSYFNSQYSTPAKIKELVQDAMAKGAKDMVQRPDGSFIIVVEMVEHIGYDQANKATKWITVIIDKAQDNIPRVRNSFPGTL